MNPIWSYPSGVVYLRKESNIPHSPESKEKLRKCYMEFQAMGYVSGTSSVEMVMEGAREEHCRETERHELHPRGMKVHGMCPGSDSQLFLQSCFVSVFPFNCY